MRISGLVVLLAVTASPPAHAQAIPFQATLPAAAAYQLTSQTPAAQPLLAPDANLVAARRFNSRAPGATLMIVGGAATVAGILVGGSGGFVLILGGIGVGAYGFYLYTR
jgi:hypothetical protein